MRKPTQSKLDPHAEALTAWFTPREQGGEGLTLDQAVARLSERYALKVSPSRLSDWWRARLDQALQDQLLGNIASGSALNKRIDAQFAKNPAPGTETIINLLKLIVQQLAVNGQANPALLELITPLMKPVMQFLALTEKAKDRTLDEKKWAAQQATKIEAGLEALFQEVKGNAEARSLFEKFKAVVNQATA